MSRGTELARRTRVAGGASLLVTMASVAALTGAAFFTVQQASCPDGGAYIQRGDLVEFAGGCIDPREIPGARPATKDSGAHTGTGSGSYEP